MDQTIIANHWNTLCRSAEASATQLGKTCSAESAEMMQAEVARFCSIKPPQTRPELNGVYTQRMALSARLTAIARADALAIAHPAARDRILDAVNAFCDGKLAADGEAFLEMQRRNLELTTAIQDVCIQAAGTSNG